jgi:hypothetical protein
MPAVGYTKPGEDGSLSFEDAPAWYEQNTEIPAEAIRLVTSLEGDPRRRGTNLSPSNSCGQITCVRQLAIKKFIPYLVSGISEWAATEGTAWHKAFESITPKVEDEYHREMLLPDDVLDLLGFEAWAKHKREGTIRLFRYTPTHESWEVRLFDGIWMNGKVDKLKHCFTRIEDFKTKGWPGWKDFKTGQQKVKHRAPGMDAAIQLNLYRRMVEVITGVNPQELVIRRMYRGSKIADESWKKYDVEVWSNDELEARIRPHVDHAVKVFSTLKDIELAECSAGRDPVPALLDEIDKLELTGHKKNLFNGTKCPLYCTQMPICFARAGMVRFETKPGETRLVQIGDK